MNNILNALAALAHARTVICTAYEPNAVHFDHEASCLRKVVKAYESHISECAKAKAEAGYEVGKSSKYTVKRKGEAYEKAMADLDEARYSFSKFKQKEAVALYLITPKPTLSGDSTRNPAWYWAGR
jgi:hypothetical protein